MINAVIFDLDGVLVSTDELHFAAWKRLGEEIGIFNFTKEDNIRQRGVSRMDSLEILLEKSDKEYTYEEKLELAARKNGYYTAMLETLSEKDSLPGVVDFLEFLRSKGIKCAVGSASKNASIILEKTKLLQYFDAIASGNDITYSKPHPQVFLVAADKLGASYGECLVVEDADAGVEAGKSAGMTVLAVGAAEHNPKADFHAENLKTFDRTQIF